MQLQGVGCVFVQSQYVSLQRSGCASDSHSINVVCSSQLMAGTFLVPSQLCSSTAACSLQADCFRSFAALRLCSWDGGQVSCLECAVRSCAIVHACNCKVLKAHSRSCNNYLCSCAASQLIRIPSVLLAVGSLGSVPFCFPCSPAALQLCRWSSFMLGICSS